MKLNFSATALIPRLATVLLLLLCEYSSIALAQSHSDLFGLTLDGRLMAVSQTAPVTCTPLRGPLPGSSQFYGLTYANGYFYSYNAAGQLFKFNLKSANDTLIGSAGYLIRGLGTRPSDGATYAVVDINSDGSGDRIAAANLTTGQVTGLIAPTGWSPGYTSGLYDVTFTPEMDLMAASAPNLNSWTYVYRVNLITSVIFGVYGSNDSPYYTGNAFWVSLATDHLSNRIMAIGLQFNPVLYEFHDQYPAVQNSSKTFIGNLSLAGSPCQVHSIVFATPSAPPSVPARPKCKYRFFSDKTFACL